MKKLLALFITLTMFCSLGMMTFAAEDTEASPETAEDTESGEIELTDTMFQITHFTYEIIEAEAADMPKGFNLGTYDYKGTEVSAGQAENSHMLCMMARDVETGYEYRFIYDPLADMFCPYFGYDIKDGYIYTVPVYEGAEIPFGFEQADYVIQTVPVTIFQREDAELTLEEIALGIVSDDAYFVFLMMDQNGEEVYYTYDLIDRTFQRAMLQIRDAETIAGWNDVVDDLHEDIAELNRDFSARMNNRLTLIVIMLAITLISVGVVVNLLLKIKMLKAEFAGELPEADDEDDEETVPVNKEEKAKNPLFEKKQPVLKEKAAGEKETTLNEESEEDDDFYDIEILDLDEE